MGDDDRTIRHAPSVAVAEITHFSHAGPRMSDATETHYPTPRFAWFLTDHNGPAPIDGKPRICCFSDLAPYVQYATLRQRWLPIIAGQGRVEEWRDVPVVTEPTP
jgi:hypothetical protein